MPGALDFLPVGELARLIGHGLLRVRASAGLTQKAVRDRVNELRKPTVGSRRISVGTLSDAENGRSNFEIGTIEEVMAAIGASAYELLKQSIYVAIAEVEGLPLERPARTRAARTSPDASPSFDRVLADDVLLSPQENQSMNQKTEMQLNLIRIAASVPPDDADYCYGALSEAIVARRRLHPKTSADTGS